MTHKLQIKYVAVDAIRPNAKNARRHPDAQIAALVQGIREFGFLAPVLVTSDMELIAGEGRWLAAQAAGLKEIPVMDGSHLSERQRRAYVLADNRINQMSSWDYSKLSAELSALAELDYDLRLTAFDEQELDALLKDDAGILPAGTVVLVDPPPVPAEQESPEVPAPTVAAEAAPPSDFNEYDEDVEHAYCCPACKYRWSGKPK